MNINKVGINIINRKNLIKVFRNPVSALKAYKKLLERRHRFIELINLVFDTLEEYERHLEELQSNKIANEITKKLPQMLETSQKIVCSRSIL